MLFQLFKRTPSISAKELQSRSSKEVTLLDVRTPSEYHTGHIPQTINVPLNRIPAYNKPANEVYVICQSGMRSRDAARTLARKNYHVINVHGGMSQWPSQIEGGK